MNWDLIFWNAIYTAINANAATYCLVASGLNVHVGYTGLLNFGQAGFAAIGAYTYAIPVAQFGWHWYAALPFVIACSDQHTMTNGSAAYQCQPNWATGMGLTPMGPLPKLSRPLNRRRRQAAGGEAGARATLALDTV